MADKNKTTSRRSFLKFQKSDSGDKDPNRISTDDKTDGDIIKMLTPDGRLVEIQRSIAEKITNKKKATNKDILEWSQNNPYKSE